MYSRYRWALPSVKRRSRLRVTPDVVQHQVVHGEDVGRHLLRVGELGHLGQPRQKSLLDHGRFLFLRVLAGGLRFLLNSLEQFLDAPQRSLQQPVAGRIEKAKRFDDPHGGDEQQARGPPNKELAVLLPELLNLLNRARPPAVDLLQSLHLVRAPNRTASRWGTLPGLAPGQGRQHQDGTTGQNPCPGPSQAATFRAIPHRNLPKDSVFSRVCR